jgi:hypothetical protein
MCVGGAAWLEASAAAREEWLGRPLDVVTLFGGHAQGWSDTMWSLNSYALLLPPTRRLALAIPMFPKLNNTHMAAAYLGDYASKYTAIAAQAVARGHGNAIIRIGWEFNSDTYPWGRNYPDMDKATYAERYVEVFRAIVEIFRSVPGNSFTFDWCPNSQAYAGGVHMTVAEVQACYPGDDYVDYIGLDFYDKNEWGALANDPVVRWTFLKAMPIGLDWHQAFSLAHGKPMSYPEWAAGGCPDANGNKDNPYFIEKMGEWIAANNVAYHSYWDRPTGEGYTGMLAAAPQVNPPYPGRPLQQQKFHDIWKYVAPVVDPHVKGINLGGGGAVTINGKVWLSEAAARADGLAVASTPIANKITTWVHGILPEQFLPPVDSETATMLNDQMYAQDTNMMITQTLPNGDYFVTLHTKEASATPVRSYGIKVQGATVHGNAGALPQNTYQKYGPYPAAVVDGVLRVELVKQTGSPSITGLEITR